MTKAAGTRAPLRGTTSLILLSLTPLPLAAQEGFLGTLVLGESKREVQTDTAIAETEIDRKMAALEEAEANLRATLALANGAAEEDLARLTDVYANMKPKQAAALFEEMDPNFAAGFLGRMRPDAAAAILAGLTPRAAYTISVVLAGRNADVPKE